MNCSNKFNEVKIFFAEYFFFLFYSTKARAMEEVKRLSNCSIELGPMPFFGLNNKFREEISDMSDRNCEIISIFIFVTILLLCHRSNKKKEKSMLDAGKASSDLKRYKA